MRVLWNERMMRAVIWCPIDDHDVCCQISCDALYAVSGRFVRDEAGARLAINTHYHAILDAAKRKYGSGQRDPDGSIFIGESDLA
jgi:hypothetical protein